MPWDLSLLRFDRDPPLKYPSPDDARSPMGTIQEIAETLEHAVPGLRFHSEPSGPERLRLMREAGIVDIPDVLLEFLQSRAATHAGDYEGRDFSITVYLGEGPVVDEIHLEVRGSGDPSRILSMLGRIPTWVLYNCMTGGILTDSSIAGASRSAQAYIQGAIAEVRGTPTKRGGA